MQEDPTNPQPCTEEERKKYPQGQSTVLENPVVVEAHDAGAAPQAGDGGADDLLNQMLGAGLDAGAAPAGDGSAEDLFNQMMGAGADGGADASADAAKEAAAPKKGSDEDLYNQMMGK